MIPLILPDELADLMKFIAEKSKNVNSPMNVAELARQFKKESGSSFSARGTQIRIITYRARIHEMNKFDIDTKVKMMFALGARVDDGFLKELKKVADVEVDDQQRIIEYKKKGGGLELVNENGKMLEFLEKKSKTVNTPMMDYSFLREFKSASGNQSTLSSLSHRYKRSKETIYESSKFNRNTKIKMMFISNTTITKNILNELQKDAIVELDEKQRIKKYEEKDGSLILERKHGRPAKRRAETKDLEDSSDSEDESEFAESQGQSGIPNGERKSELLHFSSGFSEYEFSEDDNQSAMINGRKKARISYSSSEDSENEINTGDGGEEVHDCDPPSYNRYGEILSDSVKMEEERSHQASSTSKTNEKNPVDTTATDSNISLSKKMVPPEEVADLVKFVAKKSQNVNSHGLRKENEAPSRFLTRAENEDLGNFIIDRSNNATVPLVVMQLAKDYNTARKSSQSWQSVVMRIRKFRECILQMDQIDMNTKIKLLFSLSVRIDEDTINKLLTVMKRLTENKRKHLENLRGSASAEKWRNLFKEEKKISDGLKAELAQKDNQLREAREDLERERKLRDQLEQDQRDSRDECEILRAEIHHILMKKTDVERSLEVSLNTSQSTSTQLELTSAELDNLKTLNILSAKKQAESNASLREDFRKLSSERDRISREFQKKEEEQNHRISQLGKYSVIQSSFLQRKAVILCERYMRGGAQTNIDYCHLLHNIVLKAHSDGIAPCRLTPEQTFILRSSLHLSDRDLKMAKKMFQQSLGFDVFATRGSVDLLKKDIDISENYNIAILEKDEELENKRKVKIQCFVMTIKNLELGIKRRLETLDKYKRLKTTGDSIVTCLLGDKGSKETKLCISFEDTPNPNSPDNLLPICIYEGHDNEQELRVNAGKVFEMWNQLKYVSYQSAEGAIVTKRIDKKVIGDLKFVSALLGHRGQSSSNPCYSCKASWALQGSRALTLDQVDFSQKHAARTLSSYSEDSKSGSNSVKRGSKALCQVEPEDFGIPTVHLSTGCFSRYFENHINGEINSMDRTDDNSAKTMREHKKNLTAMCKEEALLNQKLEALLIAKDDAFATATAFRLVSSNPHAHLKTPEPMCNSSFCVVNHLSTHSKREKLLRCSACHGHFHFGCSSLFSPDEKFRASKLKSWMCNECQNIDADEQKRRVFEAFKNLREEVQSVAEDQKELTTRRVDLESLLHKSTGANRQKLEEFLASIGSDPRCWYQTLGGNQVRRILRDAHIDTIFDILRDTPQNQLVKRAMKGLAIIMSKSDSQSYTDADIDDIEEILQQFLHDMKVAFPKEVLTPKLHLLGFHLIPYLRKHHSWGKTSEQGIEHYHALYNNLNRYFAPIRGVKERSRLILRELGIRNWLYDTGVSTDNHNLI